MRLNHVEIDQRALHVLRLRSGDADVTIRAAGGRNGNGQQSQVLQKDKWERVISVDRKVSQNYNFIGIPRMEDILG